NLKKTMVRVMLAGLTLLFAVNAWAAAPIPVIACGTLINTPGEYQLAADLVNCATDGIDIVSSDVHLILNGHLISGSGGRFGISVGVGVFAGVSNVKINGPATISNFIQTGIALEGVSSSSIVGITITGNAYGVGLNAAFTSNNPSLRSVGNKFVG